MNAVSDKKRKVEIKEKRQEIAFESFEYQLSSTMSKYG